MAETVDLAASEVGAMRAGTELTIAGASADVGQQVELSTSDCPAA